MKIKEKYEFMKVKCIDDMVDGLTENKEYIVTSIFIRNKVNLYGMIDDYGVYNEFRAERFKILDGELEVLTVLTKFNDVTLSIKLS